MEPQAKLALMAVLLGPLFVACDEAAAPQALPPPEVSVATPLVRQITDWDEFTGRLAAVKSVDIRARVSGYLESVDFTEGTLVEKDDLLFVIDPRPYAAVLNAAKAELTRARVRLQLAKNDLERARRLHDSRSISEEILDARTQETYGATAAMEAARAKVESAQLNVEFTRITAPISGRISRAFVTEGNLVNGGNENATQLTTIVSLDPIHFYFTGNEQIYLHYMRLDRTGARPSSYETPNPVRLRIADEEDFSHEGHMDFLDNRIDENTGTMQGRAVFPNPDLIFVPGMFAEIQLLGEGPYEALLIPDAAIGADQAQQFVFIVDSENIAHRRVIETGRLDGRLRVVRSGLSHDDRVVISGIQRVRANKPVNPQTLDLAESEASRPSNEAP